MKQNTLIKQAYVRGLAARGLLRQYIMQKQATTTTMENPEVVKNYAEPAIDELGKKDSLTDYAVYGGVGAGAGAGLGALIQAIRKQDILPGALWGAGIGGGLGLGTRATLNVLNDTGILNEEQRKKWKDKAHELVDKHEQEMVDRANDPKNQERAKKVLTGAGIGAAGGGIVGALIQAARQKNVLLGAGIGAGIGGVGGAGIAAAPYVIDETRKAYVKKLLDKVENGTLTAKENEYLAKAQSEHPEWFN